MRKKRTISISHPQLVRFRNALREVIFNAEDVEYEKLLDRQIGLAPAESKADLEKIKVLNDKKSRLNRAWKNSLCTCSLCGSRSNDMTFNPHMEEWFCVKCYEEHHAFYIEKAREGQIWNTENGAPSTEWWP